MRILLRFLFCLLFFFNTFFIIPVVKENRSVKLALAVPAGAPIKLAKEIIDTPPLVAYKAINVFSI